MDVSTVEPKHKGDWDRFVQDSPRVIAWHSYEYSELLGRFYGTRYQALQPMADAVGSVRLGLGFDLTLLLAAVNAACFAALVLGGGRGIRTPKGFRPGAFKAPALPLG